MAVNRFAARAKVVKSTKVPKPPKKTGKPGKCVVCKKKVHVEANVCNGCARRGHF